MFRRWVSHLRFLIPGAAVAFLLASCGDSAKGGPTAPEPTPAPLGPRAHSLTIEPSGGELRFHEEVQLRVVARDAQGHVLADRPVAWSSSHPFRVQVSEGGRLRGEGLGEAQITARVDSVQTTATFRVPAREVTLRMSAVGLVTIIDLSHDVECDRDCTRLVPLGALLNLQVEKGIGIPDVRWPAPCPIAGADRCQIRVDEDVELDFRLDLPERPSEHGSAIAVGHEMACALSEFGEAYCWGSNRAGKLGRGTWTSFFSEPGRADHNEPFHSLTAGFDHVCGLAVSGRPSCWGSNQRGALGDGTDHHRTVPTPVSGNPRFVQLSAGFWHTCGVTGAGEVYCWGENTNGQLGDGTLTDRATPTRVQTEVRFRQVSAGHTATCGISREGALHCWGRNDRGQLATGDFEDALHPRLSSSGAHYRQVQLGESMGCALREDGMLDCWGEDQHGNLGLGRDDRARVPNPTPVVGAHRFRELAVGQQDFACAVTLDGEALCWGGNWHAALGNGRSENANRPEPVAGGHRFTALAAGSGLACGIVDGGEAVCWGQARSGALGPDVRSHVAEPVALAGVPRSRALIGHPWQTHCALTLQSDDLYCWGGWGPLQHRYPEWQVGWQTDGLHQIAQGGGQVCGLRIRDGILICMGNAHRGRLGNGWQEGWLGQPGHEIHHTVPFVEVVAGVEHTCALAADGQAFCWGGNDHGQLGDGAWQDRTAPVPVDQGELRFITLMAAHQTTCGITSNRDLWCWGNNQHGQLGDGSRQNRNRPSRVAGGLEVATVAIGGSHTCLTVMDGAAYCWGGHWWGQLGGRFFRDQLVPVRVPGGQRFAALALGANHSCGLTQDDAVWCWGDNGYGQLGLGHRDERLGAQRVAHLPAIRLLSTTWATTCGLSLQGEVWCWGENSSGQVGIPIPRVPVRIPAPVRFQQGGAL